MGIINENFMLYNNCAKELYHNFAAPLPIIDYHCHLDPGKIADNHKFKNAYEIFLNGDHYKWRQMRSGGIAEEKITGTADDFEKWMAFAEILPYLIGNPLYHWTAMELKQYFDINEPLCHDSAKSIWDACNTQLTEKNLTTQSLIKESNVEIICTTDDPADTLEHHIKLQKEDFCAKVFPTFRPDKAIEIGNEAFSSYISSCGINSYDALLSWLSARITFFNANGCKLSDHALSYVPFALGDAKSVFEKKMNGGALSQNEIDVFKTAILGHCAALYARFGWAMQLHIGALRNNNTKMFYSLGADTGFDSINDLPVAENLSALMDHLETEDILPKTILYTLNPKDNYVLGTMLGNFQKSPTLSKIQFGSAWWFNDNRDGMEAHLKALANLGMLGGFIGMLTDSRSFVSFSRHDYFRRIFCNLIGDWVEKGEYPKDIKTLKKIVEGVCYYNAKNYFSFN
ncbi:MAG: glucuronate isomerase [Clostridia bacterium]|nr:glucuronate isomerase [Clostridia bacterium]